MPKPQTQKGGALGTPRGIEGLYRGLYRAPLRDYIGVILRNIHVLMGAILYDPGYLDLADYGNLVYCGQAKFGTHPQP